MNIAQVVSSLNIDTGGPAYSVSRLADELALSGAEVDIFALDYVELGEQISVQQANVHTVVPGTIAQAARGFSCNFYQKFKNLTKNTQLIHNHGLWMGPNYYARKVANARSIPLIISPRGMLEDWSLQFHAWKKKLAYQLYEKQNLRAAAAFHATSESEYQAIRNRGCKQPVALIENGIDIPDDECLDRSVLIQAFPELQGKRIALFMSRLHPKKGILDLVEVWARVVRQHPDWHLLIAGSDIIDMLPRLISRMKSLQIEQSTTIAGHLSGVKKEAALWNAEVLVLPSYSENFGLIIGEALAHKTPVVTSTETPWAQVVSEEHGWIIRPDRELLFETLQEVLSSSAEHLAAKGKAGRKLIDSRFRWNLIAQRMSEFYEWVLGRGACPDFVREQS